MDSAFQVFAVDDDPIVLRAIERMLRSHSIAVEGFTSPEAFLARPPYDGVACLLLDLKMPRLNGFEVLHWLKTQPGLKRLLVIVFSSSAETGDINRAYDLGANSYLVKPHATEQLLELVNRVEKYWLEANQNPNYLAA